MTNNYKSISYSSYDITIKVDVDALHQLTADIADSMLTMADDEYRKYGNLEVFCKHNYVNDELEDIRDRTAYFECYYGAVGWDAWYKPQFSWEELRAKEEPTRPVDYCWEYEEPELHNGTLCLTLEELLKHAED